MIHVNEISTTIIATLILIMTSGTGIFSSLVFAQNDSEDSTVIVGLALFMIVVESPAVFL